MCQQTWEITGSHIVSPQNVRYLWSCCFQDWRCFNFQQFCSYAWICFSLYLSILEIVVFPEYFFIFSALSLGLYLPLCHIPYLVCVMYFLVFFEFFFSVWSFISLILFNVLLGPFIAFVVWLSLFNYRIAIVSLSGILVPSWLDVVSLMFVSNNFINVNLFLFPVVSGVRITSFFIVYLGLFLFWMADVCIWEIIGDVFLSSTNDILLASSKPQKPAILNGFNLMRSWDEISYMWAF